ncbi:MAG: thiamine diphosphokinase [Elusimicrobiota bacterium]|jgi:thiamine pyrophosphokinase
MGRMKRVLILLNGALGDAGRIRKLSAGLPVLCADGGLRHALRLRRKPDFVIGDLDSAEPRLLRKAACPVFQDCDEDRCDFQKALDLALALGAREALVAGNLGGRLDHRLANFAVAEAFASRLRLTFIDEGLASLAGPGLHRLACRPGRTVSLLPASPSARVSTQGLAYALKNSILRRGSRGLSNRAISKRVNVRVHSGLLWLVLA